MSDRMIRHSSKSSFPTIGGGFILFALVVSLIVGIVFIGVPKGVNAGEGCVITRGGKIVQTADSGYVWLNVGTESAHCITTRTINYETTVGEPKEARADFKSFAPEAGSSDGQKILRAPYRIVFSVPLVMPKMDPTTCKPMFTTDAEGNQVPETVQRFSTKNAGQKLSNTAWVYENVAVDMQGIVQKVVETQTVPAVKQVLQLYPSNALFSGDLTQPQSQIFARICPIFASYGVVLDSILLNRPKFTDEFEQVIEAKQIAKEQIEVTKQKTADAEQEAKRQVAEATGQKDAAILKAQGEAESEKVKVETNADARAYEIKIAADAALYAAKAQAEGQAATGAAANSVLEGQVAAIGGGDNYVAVEQARAVGNWNITTVIGGESGVLPFLDVGSLNTPATPTGTEEPTS